MRQTRLVTLCNGSERSIAAEELWGRFQDLFDAKSQAPFAGLADRCHGIEKILTALPSIPVLPDLEAGHNNAVYFTFEDGSTERVSSPARGSMAGPCPGCGGSGRWRSIYDGLACRRCHPPVAAELVAGFVGDADA